MTIHEEIVQAFNNYLAESETFEDKSVKAAAARAMIVCGVCGGGPWPATPSPSTITFSLFAKTVD